MTILYIHEIFNSINSKIRETKMKKLELTFSVLSIRRQAFQAGVEWKKIIFALLTQSCILYFSQIISILNVLIYTKDKMLVLDPLN